MDFKMSMRFSSQDLERFLASGSNVVVAKPNEGGAPNVAWLVYRPLPDNTVSWREEYGIYASNTDITSSGALLTQMSTSELPALEGRIYPLSPSGAFGPSSPGGHSGSFYAQNNYDNLPKGYLTFGLTQAATVNGTLVRGNAVSAAPVLYNSQAVITPFTTIYLWIQSQVQSNSVLTVVTSPQTKVTFGGDVTSVSVVYEPGTGKFISDPQVAVSEELTLEHLVPELV